MHTHSDPTPSLLYHALSFDQRTTVQISDTLIGLVEIRKLNTIRKMFQMKQDDVSKV